MFLSAVLVCGLSGPATTDNCSYFARQKPAETLEECETAYQEEFLGTVYHNFPDGAYIVGHQCFVVDGDT